MADGELRVQAGRAVGRLTIATLSETVTDPNTGSTISQGPPGLTMQTLWDVAVGGAPPCLSSGTVEVQVQHGGGEDEALFAFAGCEQITVRNSLD